MGSFGWVVFGLVLGWVVSAYSDKMIGSDCFINLPKFRLHLFSHEIVHARILARAFTSTNWALF